MKRITKIKFNHEQSASLYAIAVFVVILLFVTFVNQFTFVNIESGWNYCLLSNIN